MFLPGLFRSAVNGKLLRPLFVVVLNKNVDGAGPIDHRAFGEELIDRTPRLARDRDLMCARFDCFDMGEICDADRRIGI